MTCSNTVTGLTGESAGFFLAGLLDRRPNAPQVPVGLLYDFIRSTHGVITKRRRELSYTEKEQKPNAQARKHAHLMSQSGLKENDFHF